MKNDPTGTVTGALGRAGSPLNAYLRKRYPELRSMAADYHRNRLPRRVAPVEGVPAPTLGTAFDIMLALRLDPTMIPSPEQSAFAMAESALWSQESLQVVATASQQAARQCLEDGSPDALARGAWLMALLSQVARIGAVWPTSPLALFVLKGEASPEQLLAAAPEAMVSQLVDLDALTREALIPHIEGPFFAQVPVSPSILWQAEADLFADGLLLEIKVVAGAKRADGSRVDQLLPRAFHQVLVYGLLADLLQSETGVYDVSRAGVYSARYGHLHVWNLEELLPRIASKKVTLDAERRALAAFL